MQKVYRLVGACLVALALSAGVARAQTLVYYGTVMSYDCSGYLNFLVAGYGAQIVSAVYVGQSEVLDRPVYEYVLNNVFGFNGFHYVCAW